ncbi:MAG: hypothetical protein ACAI38_16945 [Myxococcota bacterium]
MRLHPTFDVGHAPRAPVGLSWAHDPVIREPIVAPTLIERARAIGYGALSPARHMIDLAALTTVASLVGGLTEAGAAVVIGVSAGALALVGSCREALRPTRPLTSAPLSQTTIVSGIPAATPWMSTPHATDEPSLGERLLDSQLVRGAGFGAVGAALTAGGLAAFDLPQMWQILTLGGLSVSFVGLVATRRLAG